MKKVIIIGGPTAVGKTSLAIAVAQRLRTEIISADSRQCYKELAIGVARPAPQQLAQVPHHFIASHSIYETVTAATFEQYALQKAKQLFAKHDAVVMVGGTGLYIKAFCEGLDAIPDVPEAVQNEVREQYATNGLPWLQQQIAQQDPQFWAAGEVHNPQRLMRALEVFKATGKSILSFRKGAKAPRDFDIVKMALHLPKEALHHNINTRVDAMMAEGLLKEVKSLLPYQHLNALQTVGYRELFDYLNQKISFAAAVDQIKTATRQYAKRQLTWFRKDGAYHWFEPQQHSAIFDYLLSPIKKP